MSSQLNFLILFEDITILLISPMVYAIPRDFVAQFGSCGSALGQFNFLSVMPTDTAGRIPVADSNNNRVQIFEGFISSPACNPANIATLISSGAYNVRDNRWKSSATITGTASDDLILAGPNGDFIKGKAENDTIFGDAGKDTIKGRQHLRQQRQQYYL